MHQDIIEYCTVQCCCRSTQTIHFLNSVNAFATSFFFQVLMLGIDKVVLEHFMERQFIDMTFHRQDIS